MLDDIVKEGKTIWEKCRKWRIGKKNNPSKEDHESQHKLIISEHRDFASIYAIVVRSIIYENIYYEDVMEKFVKNLTNHPWKNKEEFLDRQADYLVYLNRKVNPKMGAKDVAKYKDNIRKHLHEEDKKFMENAEIMQKEIDKELEVKAKDRQKRLISLLEKRHQEEILSGA